MRIVVGLLFAASLCGGCGRSVFEGGFAGDELDASTVTSDGPRPDGGRPDASRDAGPDGGRDTGVECPGSCSFLDTACSRGTCDRGSGQCVSEPLPTGSRCDDGDPCTQSDTCFNGGFCSGRPLDCSGLDGVCRRGVCDPANGGRCSSVPARDGDACEDGVMCTVGDFCIQGMCNSGQPVGGCSNPAPIPLVVGTQRLTAALGCTADDVRTSCGLRSGDDAVWMLFNDGPRVFQVVAPAIGRGNSLAVATQCGDPGSELSCTARAGPDLTADQMVGAGPVVVAIDPGAGGFPGGVSQLQVTIDPHDRCSGAIPLTLPAIGDTLERAGTTSGANDDFQAQCAGGTASPDHVYQLTVSQPSLVDFRLDVPPSGVTYDAAMFLFDGACTGGAVLTLACDDDANGNVQPRFETTLQPGTYFLVVDGFSSGSAGEYLLHITTRPTLQTFVFPDLADARLQQVSGVYSQDGDFVEGARRPPLMTVSRADLELQIDNQLGCDVVDLAISINGQVVGTTSIFPGMVNLSLNLAFPPIVGPNYSIRYEVLRDLTLNCGGIDLPLGVSTVTLSP